MLWTETVLRIPGLKIKNHQKIKVIISSDRGLLFITSQAAGYGKDRAKLVKAYSSLYAKVVHPIMFLIASSNTECSLIFLHKCQEEIDKVS